MAKLTQDMKDIAAKAKFFIVATVDKGGKPNGVPIGFGRIISDEEIMLVDNFMYKTRRNIEANTRVAISFWSTEDHYGYQLKGKARIETSGKHFNEAVRLTREEKLPFDVTTKAAVIVTVEEVYYIGANKDSARNLVE